MIENHFTSQVAQTVLYAVALSAAVIGIVLLGDASVGSALLVIAVLFFCCYLPAQALFQNGGAEVSLDEAVVYLVAGLAGLSVCSMLAAAAFARPTLGIVPMLLGGFLAIILQRRIKLPQVRPVVVSGNRWLAAAVGLCFVAPPIMMSLQMGTGAYPHCFFNVDSPYYLTQVHSLVRYDVLPPPSLSNSGETLGYHYGTQAMAASLCRLSGIRPHVSLFLIVFPAVLLGTLGAGYRIVRDLGRTGFPAWLGLLVLFLLEPLPVTNLARGIVHLLRGDAAFIYDHAIAASASLHYGFPLISSLFGVFVMLVVFHCILRFDQPRARWLFAYLLGVLVTFKSPHFAAVVMAAACWSGATLLAKRNWVPLRWTLIGLALAFVLKGVLDTVPSLRLIPSLGYGINAWLEKWLAHGSDDPLRLAAWGSFGLAIQLAAFISFLVPAAMIWMLRRERRPVPLSAVWWFLVMPLVFVNLFVLVDQRSGVEGTLIPNILQVCDAVFVAAAALLAAILASHWDVITQRSRRWVVAAVVGFVLLPLFQHMQSVLVVAVTPNRGHEFVSNQQLAAALQSIPVEGSVLVTNDFRYPANNYRRDLRQLQLPAIFGHQCYAVNFAYERFRTSDERLRQQRLIRQQKWNPGLLDLASENRWTHLLIDRAAPHAEAIPLKAIFENDRYCVYQFAAAGSETSDHPAIVNASSGKSNATLSLVGRAWKK